MSDRQDTRAIAPLSVQADLTVSVDGVDAAVESTGDRLLVGFRSLSDAFRAIRRRPDGGETRLAALLTATDLTVEIRVRDRIVAVAGPDARPGVLSRLLGVDPVEVRIDGALGAAAAEAGAMLSATMS